MNYIKELNAFQKWQLTNELSTGAVALWHSLISLNNSSGWKTRFNAPNSIVEHRTGLSKQGVAKARKQLVEKELILYEKGSKGKAAVYQMVSFHQEVEASVDSTVDQSNDLSGDILVDEKYPIPKQKLNKRKERRGGMNPFVVYEENFGILKPILRDSLIAWCEELGDEMVIEAIKLAVQKRGRTFSYLEAILKEWAEVGLKDVDQVRVHEKQKEKRNANTLPFKKQKQSQKAVLFEELRREIGT